MSGSSRTMRQWILQGNTNFDDLKAVECPIPEVSGNDVLVKVHAASLNYRDLMIAKVRITRVHPTFVPSIT